MAVISTKSKLISQQKPGRVYRRYILVEFSLATTNYFFDSPRLFPWQNLSSRGSEYVIVSRISNLIRRCRAGRDHRINNTTAWNFSRLPTFIGIGDQCSEILQFQTWCRCRYANQMRGRAMRNLFCDSVILIPQKKKRVAEIGLWA